MDNEELNIKILKPIDSNHKIDKSKNPRYLEVGHILEYAGKYQHEETGLWYMMFNDGKSMPESDVEFFLPEEFNMLFKFGVFEFI